MKVQLRESKAYDKNSSYSLLTVTSEFFPAVVQIDDSNYIRISFSIMQSCLNIIDNYKMVQFFRNSVIGNYSAMLSRQKAVFHYKLFQCVWEREFVLHIFIPEETERVRMSSQTTTNFDPDKSRGKLQQEFSTLNN